MMNKQKIEFGDFQTPFELAKQVTRFVKRIFPAPSIVVEPTCGLGNFVKASIEVWGSACSYFGFDINEHYISLLKRSFKLPDNCSIKVSDFFSTNWHNLFNDKKDSKILVIGNPPWVTNSVLGSLKSNNLPAKNNFQNLGGFAAKTGKANFDIAEWMIIKIIENLQGCSACLAMLCKTATARKVLKYFWINNAHVYNSSIHIIDAKKHFNVSVDACLFITHIDSERKSKDAYIYNGLSFENKISHCGISGNELIANIDDFKKYHQIDGIDYYRWRSGIKHDAVKVMELTRDNGIFINGFDDVVAIESDYIYPLLKSSDIGNNRITPQKYVIVTQKNIGDDTSEIKIKAPKTWAYLEKHSDILDWRKSIIYKKRPRFSVFGIGDYSFTPWKVAISGLYKDIHFAVVGKQDEKPTMLDDTCYFIPCDSREEALFLAQQLNSETCLKFLKSLIFFDAKRPINIDILRRVDLKKLSELNEMVDKAMKYLSYAQTSFTHQPLLVFEKREKYLTKRCT